MSTGQQRKRPVRAVETAPTEVRARRGSPATRRGRTPPESHARELWGLATLGIAVFLTFVLVVGTGGGVLGGAAAGALEVALGRLAFLVPVALLALAVVLMGRVRVSPAGAVVAGSILILLSLFILLAGGFPPFGPPHPAAEFVSGVYRLRGGWVGEVLYVGVSGLLGQVGLALVGWLSLVAGISLVTGWTLRRMAQGTRRAARAVGHAASTTVRKRTRPSDRPGPLDDPYLSGFGPGAPDELDEEGGVWAAWPEETVYAGPGAPLDAGAETERMGGRRPLLTARQGSPVRLRDAATDFPDFYAGEAEVADVDAEPGLHEGSETYQEGETEHGTQVVSQPGLRTERDVAADAAVAAQTAGGAVVGLRSGREEEEAAPAAAAGAAEEKSGGGSGTEETQGSGEPEAAGPDYVLPESLILRKSQAAAAADVRANQEVGPLLVETLAHFGVDARVSGTVVGPRVTRYELQLAPGTKVNKVTNLKDDIAYALATTEIRILAPIPGKSAVGVEVPNQRPDYVTLGDIYREFPASAGPLMVWLGKDIAGKAVYTDLTKMPHLLIAGTTGSGKSGCINCIISSVLLRSTPEQVRMVMIDPKKVELSHYERIPHLLVPVVTKMKSAAGVLSNLVREMDERYTLMEMVKARNLYETNRARVRRGEPVLPYVLIVIDELADLMMVSPAEVEECVIRLAQKARAVGIHLVVATQRPSADVITGMIKANIPSRIAFAVSSQTDSRVILDVNGAEALLGSGDMLFKPLGSSRLQRIQGAFITEEEIHTLVTHWRRQAEPTFQKELLQSPEEAMAEEAVFDPDSDELIADAAELVLDTGNASVSMLQRRLRVGYTRAGRLIDMLERRGIVGPYEGSKPRQVLVKPIERLQVLEGLRNEVRSGRPPQLTFDEEGSEDEAD